MTSLKEGLELSAIHFNDPAEKCPFIIGKNCKRITVSMENGQMAGVPWAVIDTTIMVNLAMVEMIEIKGGE